MPWSRPRSQKRRRVPLRLNFDDVIRACVTMPLDLQVACRLRLLDRQFNRLGLYIVQAKTLLDKIRSNGVPETQEKTAWSCPDRG